jgi:hypothetical protein
VTLSWGAPSSCGCFCHRVASLGAWCGRKVVWVRAQPTAFDDPVARVTACKRCRTEHDKVVGVAAIAVEAFQMQQKHNRVHRYFQH